MAQPPNRIELQAPGWSSGPVLLARTVLQRWRGMRSVPLVNGVLLRTRSVHGFGLRDPIWAIGLTEAGTVRGAAVLSPGGLVLDRDAEWFLELPLTCRPPQPGWRLTPMVGTWPEP